jgi:hypothetical protein
MKIEHEPEERGLYLYIDRDTRTVTYPGGAVVSGDDGLHVGSLGILIPYDQVAAVIYFLDEGTQHQPPQQRALYLDSDDAVILTYALSASSPGSPLQLTLTLTLCSWVISRPPRTNPNPGEIKKRRLFTEIHASVVLAPSELAELTLQLSNYWQDLYYQFDPWHRMTLPLGLDRPLHSLNKNQPESGLPDFTT